MYLFGLNARTWPSAIYKSSFLEVFTSYLFRHHHHHHHHFYIFSGFTKSPYPLFSQSNSDTNAEFHTMSTTTTLAPTAIIATSCIQQPVRITVPGTATISITAETNASYHQKVTVSDITGGTQYTFHGQGEGKPMQVKNQTQNDITLAAVGNPYRTLSVFCEHSIKGEEGTFSESKVLCPRTLSHYEESGSASNAPLRISWEISTEDGGDEDFNDSVIRIVANLDQ